MLITLAPTVGWAHEPVAMSIDGHVIHTSPRKAGSWQADVVKHEWPEYPYEARSRHIEGKGWFRLLLRSDGSVEDVKVMQSTGTQYLDRVAIDSFFRWRFKANKWKWVDEPMWFSMHGPVTP